MRSFTGATYIIGAIFVLMDISSDTILFMGYINNHRFPFPIFAIFTGIWIGLGAILQCGVALFLAIRGGPNGLFKSLPPRIRIFILVTSPLLISPVVLNIYGAYLVIRHGITNITMEKNPMVIANLKFAEVIFESVPQLLTQGTIVVYEIDQSHKDFIDTYVCKKEKKIIYHNRCCKCPSA